MRCERDSQRKAAIEEINALLAERDALAIKLTKAMRAGSALSERLQRWCDQHDLMPDCDAEALREWAALDDTGGCDDR